MTDKGELETEIMSSSSNNYNRKHQQPPYKRYTSSFLHKFQAVAAWTIVALFALSRSENGQSQYFCHAYRVGDVVDTYLLLDAARSDVLRSQMPKFGINYIDRVQFDVPPLAKTFALQFEDGVWTTPVTHLSQSGGGFHAHWQFLERVQIQFVYSKSGTGAIHAVTAKDIIYSSEQRPYFVVEYQWIEDETVYLSSGHTVLFLAALVSCIYFLLVSCGIIGSDTGSVLGGTTSRHSSSSSAVPKWD